MLVVVVYGWVKAARPIRALARPQDEGGTTKPAVGSTQRVPSKHWPGAQRHTRTWWLFGPQPQAPIRQVFGKSPTDWQQAAVVTWPPDCKHPPSGPPIQSSSSAWQAGMASDAANKNTSEADSRLISDLLG